MKTAGLRIRVEEQLRDRFKEACRVKGKTASQVIREYMRQYVINNPPIKQRLLFPELEDTKEESKFLFNKRGLEDD